MGIACKLRLCSTLCKNINSHCAAAELHECIIVIAKENVNSVALDASARILCRVNAHITVS